MILHELLMIKYFPFSDLSLTQPKNPQYVSTDYSSHTTSQSNHAVNWHYAPKNDKTH